MMSGMRGTSQPYYAVLGVQPGAPAAEIRAAYHRLAMKWHPDKVANGRVDPALAEEAKRRFQQIHEAYQVLSDENRRALYDAGMYDLDDDQEDVEGFHDFLQEMLSLMATVRREEPVYSLDDLRSMLAEMMESFGPSTQPAPSGFFAAGGGGGSLSFGSSTTRQRSTSSRMHSQGIGSSTCFSRTAFSSY